MTSTVREITPGVLVSRARLWSSLTTVVVADSRCLVVDPGITPSEIGRVADELRARDLRVDAGFSTHPHWDHVLWSPRWLGAPRWATTACVRRADESRAYNLAEADSLAPGHDHDLVGRLVPIPRTDGGALRIPWTGADSLVVEHDAHARGHAALVLPGRRVLVAGDMLSDREVPLLDTDAVDPVTDYRRALDLLAAQVVEHGVTALVPGHGSPALGSRAVNERFTADRRYLDAIEHEARHGCGDEPRAACSTRDTRLTDPWVAGEHRAQVAALGRSRG
ncbi:Glyoxylase, beta-lactamase superfamily II [Paraoerskovia marina]|uniref:Glyoxylase, beta-lactamase superfamily II n=1 Tax=Paraoerskovia marina TaxID=545619 RepID=A0A1H1TXA3_9CELL|nr:MBL fold metallo-hydrolase [Paraoerskovia marina]SDS64586.1 Glyoxylase, beta-lactamase superfamily II [Paraoerskovia marina]